MAERLTDEFHPLNGPPRYSTLSLVTLPTYPSPGELDISRLGNDPTHGGRGSRQAFDFCIEATRGAAWATLRLFSTVPASLQRPRYIEGQNVEGVVLLDLQRSSTLISVSVVLKGQMVTSSRSDGTHPFLEVVTPLLGDGAAAPAPTASDGKLQGRHALPFTVPFPTEFPDSFAHIKDKRRGHTEGDTSVEMYPLPQTVCQRGVNANVQYEVTLKITTGGLFKSKHKVSGAVLYVPVIRAPPLPLLRASAYVGGSFLIGPEDDPTGWQPLPTFNVRATVRGGESYGIECTAYIANPTAYTRGTVIPCYLVCSTSNTDDQSNAVLHAFVAQNSVSLDLFQRVDYSQDPRVAAPLDDSGVVKASQSGRKGPRNDNSEESGTAVWWTPQAHVARGAVKENEFKSMSELSREGEVHLDVGLLPTCKVPFLEVSHNIRVSLKGSDSLGVELVPKGRTAGSRKSPAPTETLPSWTVRIVTAQAPTGPVPAPFTPRPAKKKPDRTAVQELQYMSNNFSVYR